MTKYPLKITTDFLGRPWIVNTYGEIHSYTGNEWIKHNGYATDISVEHHKQMWITGMYGEVQELPI